MWILTFFPAFVIHLVLASGLLLFLAAMFMALIPIISKYKEPIKILSVVLIAFGSYLEGGMTLKNKTDLQISNLRVALAEARVKSEEKNVEIVTEIVTETKIIKEKGDTIIRYIDREIVKYNQYCEIPDVVVTTLNEAASLGRIAK